MFHWPFLNFSMADFAHRSLFGRTSETPTTTTSQKVSQYTSHLYCNTPPICIAVLLVPLGSKEREKCQYSSHLYRSTPPICIAIHLPFVSQYFWENLGGCGHRDVPQLSAMSFCNAGQTTVLSRKCEIQLKALKG